MTGRERLTNILNRQPTDRVAWTTLVDDKTRSVMPPDVRAMPVLDFYRYIECDILQFGNYGLPADCQVQLPCQLVPPETQTRQTLSPEGLLTTETETEWGTLTATFREGHPLRHPVQSPEELRTFTNLWLNSRCEEVDGAEESFARAEAALGDDGAYVPTLAPSPVQQLIELDMGMAGFYYLLQDCPREMARLMEAMQHCRRQEYEITARRMPALALILVENTSTTMISPSVYRTYSLPQVRDFVEAAHRHGKRAILHMCGHLKDLLPVIRETGFDGVNGLTPPSIGDTHFEEALDLLGEDFIILGGVFSGDPFHQGAATAEEIGRALNEMLTPRIRKANFLLWVAADGLPTPLARFLAVRDWFRS